MDDGKSTLIGRLLLDAKLILEDQLDGLHRAGRNGEPDLASITDGLRSEREQGITIDVAYRYFTTPRRSFIIADTPGHVRYTRNMVTGASTAQVAIILLDARTGIVEQSRRHAYLSALLGIRHLVAAVNKMDLVDWDESAFRSVESEFLTLAERLGVEDAVAIPISALNGDNVVARRSGDWYGGPPLLGHLEELDPAPDRDTGPFRLPVQWVIRPRDGERDADRTYAGALAGGAMRAGDEVLVLPSGARTSVEGIETFDGPLEEASPPASVSVRLEDDLDVARGDVLCSPSDPPVVGREIEATLCWISDEPLTHGARYALKQTTRSVRATVGAIESRLDLETLEYAPPPARLELNDIARVRLRTSAPVVADPYSSNRVMGAFILIDEHTGDTVGAGMVIEVAEGAARSERRPELAWHAAGLDRDRRWSAIGQSGATVVIAGAGAEAPSLATALEKKLIESGRAAYQLEQAVLGELDPLGCNSSERVEPLALFARRFADAGTVAIVAIGSLSAAERTLMREAHATAGLPFLEVDATVGTSVDDALRALDNTIERAPAIV